MKNFSKFLAACQLLAGFSQLSRAADLPLANDDRIVILGDSLICHGGFPNYSDYLASYLITHNPSLTLHIQSLGRSGLPIEGLLDSSPIGYQHYSKWAAPLAPKFVFVMFADNGGYSKATDKQLTQTLVDDYIVGRSHATAVLMGMIPQANSDGYHLGGQYDDAIEEIALAASPQLSYFKTWQALSPTWTSNIVFTADASTGLLSATGHGFADGTRVIFEGGTAPAPLVPNSYYFVRDASSNTFRLTATSGGAAIPLTTNGAGTMRISANWAKLRAGSADSVHPGPTASAIAAWKLITGLGWSTQVSGAVIDAPSATVMSKNDCTITNVTHNALGGIDFSRLDARLPWAIDEVGRPDAVALFPAMSGWQNYSLKVTGLAIGNYEIFCNGESLSTVPSTTLSTGWNMSDITTGPVWRQCQEVLGRIRDMQGMDRTTLTEITSPRRIGVATYESLATYSYATLGYTGISGAVAQRNFLLGLDASRYSQNIIGAINNYDAAIHAAAQPTNLSFSIRRTNALLGPGSMKVKPIGP